MITQRIDLSGPPLTRQFLQSLCFVCASFFTVSSAFADELMVDSTPITGGTATFTFDIQGSVSGLEFRVGKQGDSKAYYDSEDDSSFSNATREVTLNNLPTDGEDIRARLNYNGQSSAAGNAVNFPSTAGNTGGGDTGGGTNGTTLADLDCSVDQIAIFDGSDWRCGDQASTLDIEDIIASIETMFCEEGEGLTRGAAGVIACENICPYVEQLEQNGFPSVSSPISDAPDTCYMVGSIGDQPVQILLDRLPAGLSGRIILSDTDPATPTPISAPEAQACALFVGCENFDITQAD